MQKKIALLHRHPADRIKETNAAFPYLQEKGIEVLTFKTFDRLGKWGKFFKSLAWIFYAPWLVIGKPYDVIYCDDSYPFYPALVKLVSPHSKVVIRLGDLHLMYYYSGITYKILHFFEKIGWRSADKILTISKAMETYVRQEIGRWPETILDPVDPKDFPLSDRDRTIPKTVMFHGLLVRNKNVDVLLEAARRMPEVNFVVIGDGPDRRRLEGLSPNNVFFRGWVPFKSISRHIATCAIGVALRSDNPGNEYVVTSPFLQYGIMGKPCLVTRRKVFGDYEWQFSGADEMVEKLENLLTAQVDSKRLRNAFIEHHGAEKIAEEIWKILTSV